MAAVRIVTRVAFGTWALVQANEIVLVEAQLAGMAIRTHEFVPYSLFCRRCGIHGRELYARPTRCPSLP